MSVLQRLQQYIKQHALFNETDKVLLAVSGGRDSVLMTQLFREANYSFGIAHCNFTLRGKESDEDELFTSNLARELDVPFHTIRFDTAEYAKTNHISVQMAARDLRYAWLEEIRLANDYSKIALAHHQNDEIETMILNLTRGTGIAGLHGILPMRGQLVRPLLFLSRTEIDDLIKSSGLKFREDESNSSRKYARNKIRHEVIPVLKELNPSLEHTFEANRKRFGELELVLNQYLEIIKKELFIEVGPEEFIVDLDRLKKHKPIDTILYGLFQPFGFTEQVLGDLRDSWNGTSGKVFRSSSFQILLDRNQLLLNKLDKIPIPEVQVSGINQTVSWLDTRFRSSEVDGTAYQIISEKLTGQFNADLLLFPLTLRSWRQGDYFYPMGMKGKKKLSDLFIAEKIPLSLKKQIPVLVNGNGDIIWIAGIRTDKRYKINYDTKKVFIFEQYT